MNPREEAKSLIEHPLPENITEEDRRLPTRINIYDHEIALLEETLMNLRRERYEALERALKTGCTADDQYRIEEVKILGDRVVDSALLQSRFPDRFSKYLLRRSDDINSAFEKSRLKALSEIETKINLGTADKVFGKDNVTACSVRTVTVSYVIKGRGSLQ